MAEMRASPVKSQALKRLADIVRLAEERGEMEILPFNPATLFPVSSTTLENLAYGNLPMAIPSQSNIPITKTGRKQEVAELAGLLPTLPAASRGIAKGANYLGDVLTQAVTRNPQATSMRALDEISRMSPVPQMFDPALAKRVMPKTALVDESGNPRLLYHGTKEDFEQFDPGSRGAVFASPDPKFTNVYAGEDMDRYLSGGNVRPVYVDAKNPFDYDNPDHVKAVVQYIKKNDPDFADIADSVGEKVGTGVYSQIERPLVQNAIRQLGFDGFFVQERGIKNIAVFDPQQVKSALSNQDIMEQFLASSKPPKPEPTYGMEHRPMGEAGGASRLHEAYKSFGEDVYGKNALQYFGSGDPREAGVVRLMRSIRDNPDREVTIYRGVPEGVEGKINPGDWITLDKNVAEDYGKVVSMKVKAKDITTWPDSLLEFGYFPE